MSQTRTPLQVPIAHPISYHGEAPRDQAVLQSDRAYWARELIYGAPSVVPTTMSVRQHAATYQAYAARPDWENYEHVVVWLTRTPYESRPPIGYSVAQQRARSFGGTSPMFYQALAAPTLDEVARHFGGVMNG